LVPFRASNTATTAAAAAEVEAASALAAAVVYEPLVQSFSSTAGRKEKLGICFWYKGFGDRQPFSTRPVYDDYNVPLM